MPIQIDSMQSEVHLLPSNRESSGDTGTGTATAMDMEQLKEVLRPLVLELLHEDLETYMRMRG